MGKCELPGCFPNLQCKEGNIDFKKDCSHWVESSEDKPVEQVFLGEEGSHLLTWTGNSLGLDDLDILKERSSPKLFGSVGEANSGKTTFLGLLYLLLNSGSRIDSWMFANSYSVLGWEYLANYLRYTDAQKFSFPPRTSTKYGRGVGMLHLGLKSESNLVDFVLTDVPGEWFSNWANSVDDPNAGDAPWIDENSDGFLFFIDCDELASNRQLYRHTTIKLLRRVQNNLKNRPVAVLWSKSDLLSNVNNNDIAKIQRELQKFVNCEEFYISINPGKGNQFHRNIIRSIKWLIEQSNPSRQSTSIEFQKIENDDYFLSYRG